MKLEILGAEEEDDGKFTLKVKYDWEFCAAVAKAYGSKFASEKDVEEFILYVIDDLDLKELDKIRYEMDK